jgi:hypothetical protein
MIIYFYLLLVVLLMLYLQPIIALRWQFDYYKELEKQCLIKKINKNK